LSERDRTKKIRTLIVDDEPLARSNLIALLGQDPEIQIVGECSSGAEALAEIRRAKPDLIFLDIQMPECDGFDVIEQVGISLPPAIVFVTAYDQYAVKAFEAGALDYLLKPFDDNRFNLALARAKVRIALGREHPKKPEILVIKGTGQVSLVRIVEIDWIEAADYYACLHVGTRTHMLRRRMSDLERDLDQNMFCRIHRSTIVNLDRVRSLELNREGDYTVLLDSGIDLRLSRRYRKHLHSRFGIRNLK